MMKQLLQISALAAGLLVVGCQTETQPESKLEDKSGPYDHFFFQRSYPDAAMDIVAFDKASDKVRNSLSNQVQKNISGNWTSQGPGNIGGRFNCLAVHPDDEMMYNECMSKPSTQISDDLLAIHTYDVDSHVQSNEAVLFSLSKFGNRGYTPPNSAVIGAMPPGSSSSVLASASCNH